MVAHEISEMILKKKISSIFFKAEGEILGRRLVCEDIEIKLFYSPYKNNYTI